MVGHAAVLRPWQTSIATDEAFHKPCLALCSPSQHAQHAQQCDPCQQSYSTTQHVAKQVQHGRATQ
ncbi:hypothetical protein RirG_031590 [Rhizophagus irregularis DAOM 197198w]|uniref:Uncharacterized protein n=1 Tax=Rhizophagus irregularis (strain DAOM 197198w) TaxID=1432141 RepID=A0A015NBP6_RHIIW|nr:hypothetical protein RirG_031590 [Rhizophagus irregularis DAOM 197198w]